MRNIKQGAVLDYVSRFGTKARFLYCGKIKVTEYRHKYLLFRMKPYGKDYRYLLVDKGWMSENKKRLEVLQESEDKKQFHINLAKQKKYGFANHDYKLERLANG